MPSRFAARRQTYIVRDPSPPRARTADAKRPSQQRSKLTQDARSALFHPPTHTRPRETDPQLCRDALLDPAPAPAPFIKTTIPRAPANDQLFTSPGIPVADRSSQHTAPRKSQQQPRPPPRQSKTLRRDVTPQPHVHLPHTTPRAGSLNESARQRPQAHKTHAQQQSQRSPTVRNIIPIPGS